MNKKVSIKQDINFLDKPIWFLDCKNDGLGFVWKEIDGYEYRTSYKLPDHIDMLILFYFLHLSQENSYSQNITCTRRKVLTSCKLSTSVTYYKRLEDSIKRWSSVSIHFKGTFYDDKRYQSLNFGIIDNGGIDKDSKKVFVEFNRNWLLKIKESRFFKYVNFQRYKMLKRPASRKLHEILCAKFLNRDKWTIGLVKLGKKLTLSGREKDGKKVIYASDVLTVLKPALNEINKMVESDPEMITKVGELGHVTYFVTGKNQDRSVTFEHHRKTKNKQSKQTENSESLDQLLKIPKRMSKKLEALIREYTNSHGNEYVKWSLLYANQKAKSNYFLYVKKTLAENWAEDWAEEEKKNRKKLEEAEKQKQEALKAEMEKKNLEERLKKQKDSFVKAVGNLEVEIKQELWDKAEKETPQDVFRRDFNVKITYAQLLLEYFNKEKAKYSSQVIGDLKLIGEISLH